MICGVIMSRRSVGYIGIFIGLMIIVHIGMYELAMGKSSFTELTELNVVDIVFCLIFLEPITISLSMALGGQFLLGLIGEEDEKEKDEKERERWGYSPNEWENVKQKINSYEFRGVSDGLKVRRLPSKTFEEGTSPSLYWTRKQLIDRGWTKWEIDYYLNPAELMQRYSKPKMVYDRKLVLIVENDQCIKECGRLTGVRNRCIHPPKQIRPQLENTTIEWEKDEWEKLESEIYCYNSKGVNEGFGICKTTPNSFEKVNPRHAVYGLPVVYGRPNSFEEVNPRHAVYGRPNSFEAVKTNSFEEVNPRHAVYGRPNSFEAVKTNSFEAHDPRQRVYGCLNSFEEVNPRYALYGRPNSFEAVKPNSFEADNPRKRVYGRPNSFEEVNPRHALYGRPNSFEEVNPRHALYGRPNSFEAVKPNSFEEVNPRQRVYGCMTHSQMRWRVFYMSPYGEQLGDGFNSLNAAIAEVEKKQIPKCKIRIESDIYGFIGEHRVVWRNNRKQWVNACTYLPIEMEDWI